MTAVGVRVVGGRRMRATLKKASGDLDDLKDANARAAGIVAAAARPTAPHRSGALAGSVRPNRAAGRAVVMAGGARVPYAGPIHWGWPARRIAPNPFLAAAAQATEPVWLPAYEVELQQILDTVQGA